MSARALGGLRAVLVAVVALLGVGASAAQSTPLPTELQDGRLDVVMFSEFPPYVFRDASGELEGSRPATWAAWSEATGIPVTINALPLAEAFERVLSGRADVIDLVTTNEERESILRFSEPYETLNVVLFYDAALSGIVDAGSARGFEVGVGEGDACEAFLRRQGLQTLRTFRTIPEMISAIERGELRVFCLHEHIGAYYLTREGLADDFRKTEPLYSADGHYAVRVGSEALLAFVEDGMASVPSEELQAIEDRWLGGQIASPAAAVVPRWVRVSGAALAVALVVALVFLATLRGTVLARTRDLSAALDAVEDARRESEDARSHLAAILAAVPDPTVELDAAGCVHQAYLPDVAYCPWREAGTRPGVRVSEVLPEASARALEQALADALAQGSADAVDLVVETGGRSHVFQASFRRVDLPNEDPRVIMIARDETRRRRMEQELERHREGLESEVRRRTAELEELNDELTAILDSATSGVALVVDGRFEAANEGMAALVGIPRTELLGQSAARFRPEDRSDEEREAIYERLASGDTVRVQQRIVRADGTAFMARVSARRVDVDESDRGIVYVVDDVTAEYEAAEAMRDARELAERSARAKSDFLANMSHEIRTPMNAIMGLIHLADQTEMSETQRGYLRKIRTASRSLLGIINDILDLSKIEAGRLEIESIEFDLIEVIRDVSDLVAAQAQAKDLELLLEVDPDVPIRAVGDPLRIGQILTNFGSNAVKFTEEGEIRLHVAVEEDQDDTMRVRFEVRDTGVGIAPENQAMLFENFQQLDASTTRKYGGTGLGLAISKRLAEMMGGRIGVDSVPGEGSTFWFTIPLTPAEAQPQHLVPDPDLRGRRILVADDHPGAREVLGAMLASMTFRVLTVATGSQAVAAVRDANAEADPFDVVLLDWQMPELDGIAAARQIRAQLGTDAPRMAIVTGHGRQEVLRRTESGDVDTVLIKPLDPSILFDAIVGLLGGRPRAMRTESSKSRVARDLSPLAGARVLLVEDNLLNQEIAGELLQRAGLQVTIAGDGEQALARLDHDRFDLVLMDMQMPVMDGLDATRAIRAQQRFQDLPVIAMTANATDADRQRCFDAGMVDFVPKPIEPSHLWATLLRWAPAASDGEDAATPAAAPVDAAAAAPAAAPAATPAAAPATAPSEAPLPPLEHVDVAAGMRRALDDAGLYRSLLRQFVQGQADVPAAWRAAVAAGDREGARRVAHTLKGAAAQIGAGTLSAAAADLEQRAKGNDPLPADVPAHLTAALTAVLDELNGVLDGATAQPAQGGARDATDATDADDAKHAAQASAVPLVQRLRELLAAHDFEAHALVEERRTELREALGPAFDPVVDAIDAFDYAAARARLESD